MICVVLVHVIGFFQVVKYWPAKGKSGFLVWRYLLKRDDDEPAPWTRDGKERIKKLGLTMQVKILYTKTVECKFKYGFSVISGCDELPVTSTMQGSQATTFAKIFVLRPTFLKRLFKIKNSVQ